MQLHFSEHRACAVLGKYCSTQRKIPPGREDEQRLTTDIIELARQYGRYGCSLVLAITEGADRPGRPYLHSGLLLLAASWTTIGMLQLSLATAGLRDPYLVAAKADIRSRRWGN